MATRPLTDKNPKDTYKSLAHVYEGSNEGFTTTLKPVTSGDGANSSLSLSTSAGKITGNFEVTGTLTAGSISGGAAPATSTYIVKTADATLTNEFALSTLSNGLVYVTTTTGDLGSRVLTGTADRITITNGDAQSGAPTVDISATYIGQNTITTLGTITTGVWNGTAVPVANGGTGATSAADARTNLNVQPLDAGLTALAAFNTNGVLCQTAADTFSGRTITGTSNEVSVADGDGVSGNPTLSLPATIDLGDKTSFEIPNAAGGTSISAAGQICVDTTRGSLNVHDGSAERAIDLRGKICFSIETPDSSEDLFATFLDDAFTITKMVAVLVGSSTPSVTWTVRHHTDRSNAGNEVVTSGTTTTSTTTGSVVTSFNDATIPADSFVWVETTAQSGTVDLLNITIYGYWDP